MGYGDVGCYGAEKIKTPNIDRLAEESILARWPGKIKPGTRSAETISLTDMLATFAAIVGKELPPGAGPDSYNVLPAMLGQKLPYPQRPLVMTKPG